MTPLLVALYVLLLDQASKEWVRGAFDLHQSIELLPGFFSLTYIRNTGAAWGMFSGQNLTLALLALVMLIALVLFRRKILPPGVLHRVALGLLCGGIAGNLFDRLRLDYVTDYLDFHIGTWHWPAFNIADSAICIGVGIYLLGTLLISPSPAPPAPES
ncbi:MAG: signal peptidase II [Kiritimatiellia bacterium]|jgi:signal peptidase II|nr:signal peptidase II [Kiritimatiellia bacterium]